MGKMKAWRREAEEANEVALYKWKVANDGSPKPGPQGRKVKAMFIQMPAGPSPKLSALLNRNAVIHIMNSYRKKVKEAVQSEMGEPNATE